MSTSLWPFYPNNSHIDVLAASCLLAVHGNSVLPTSYGNPGFLSHFDKLILGCPSGFSSGEGAVDIDFCILIVMKK